MYAVQYSVSLLCQLQYGTVVFNSIVVNALILKFGIPCFGKVAR